MTSKSNNKNDFRVRLSRTSSAQAVLKKERRKSCMKIDDILDDNKSMDTVTGKLPVEAAYVIMKRVTEEVGQPLNAAGLSTFNKLQSLKTTPAVDLLLQKSWREFFTKKKDTHTLMSQTNINNNTNNILLPPGTTTTGTINSSNNAINLSTEDFKLKQKEIKQHLNQTFKTLTNRVEILWKKLKIPHADQEFYRKTLLKKPIQSVQQCKEISNYIILLKKHEINIINILNAIQLRELSIVNCYDILSALQRKFSRLSNINTLFNTTTTTTTNTTTNNNTNIIESNNFWKEELINSLHDVRNNSIIVIKLIQKWRKLLWRPQPFIYMNMNYLLKMKNDLNILETDMYIRLLGLVPLYYNDLQCILFISNNNTTSNSNSNNNTDRIDTTTSLSRNNSNTTTLHSPNKHHTTTTNNNTNNTTSSRNSTYKHTLPQQLQSSEHSSYITDLITSFRQNISSKELQLAANVVLDEEVLQNALNIEHSSLLNKGVFIPILHLQSTTQLEEEENETINNTTNMQNNSHNNSQNNTSNSYIQRQKLSQQQEVDFHEQLKQLQFSHHNSNNLVDSANSSAVVDIDSFLVPITSNSNQNIGSSSNMNMNNAVPFNGNTRNSTTATNTTINQQQQMGSSGRAMRPQHSPSRYQNNTTAGTASTSQYTTPMTSTPIPTTTTTIGTSKAGAVGVYSGAVTEEGNDEELDWAPDFVAEL